jgi:ABC-type multidrug transport system fused ATPase/permease subunit
MKERRPMMRLVVLLAVASFRGVFAFVPTTRSSRPAFHATTALFAKKKGPSAAAAAALENLQTLEDELDQPLSMKELKALEKKQKKQRPAEDDNAPPAEAEKKKSSNAKDQILAAALDMEASLGKHKSNSSSEEESTIKLSKKDQMLQKALEMEDRDNIQAASVDDEPKLSKKEIKALQKKEEKMAAKLAKKQARKDGSDDDPEEVMKPDINGFVDAVGSHAEEPKRERQTLEDKIRKERPPPRIRVMESTQPGYTSLRLENVGITFRNQEVLKDVTWGVQTGDRIGLVGANGAGEY